MHSLNFGIQGDRTENLLWRLQNGELDCLAPKAIVLNVGTNNHGDSAEDIAEGIKTICSLIRDKQPQAYLVVLTLLPRGHVPNDLRKRNARVNDLVREQLKVRPDQTAPHQLDRHSTLFPGQLQSTADQHRSRLCPTRRHNRPPRHVRLLESDPKRIRPGL